MTTTSADHRQAVIDGYVYLGLSASEAEQSITNTAARLHTNHVLTGQWRGVDRWHYDKYQAVADWQQEAEQGATPEERATAVLMLAAYHELNS